MTKLLPPTRADQRAQELATRLSARDVRYCQIEVPDLDGGMRTKLVSLDKALAADGVALCSIVFGLTAADVRDLGLEFMDRMAAIDAPLDSFHTELGYGMVEFALAHAPALDAADRSARAKAYFKQLCAERGLVATFMAKWKPGESGSGAHVHQSLWRHGQNVFAGDDGGLSSLARHYAAGQLATMPAFTAIFNPNVNSYRRISVAAWTPENATWGIDNRTAALRAITASAPKAVRLEHRRSGADANPYLIMAAMLAGGLHGLETAAEPPEPSPGNAALDLRAPPLPASLPDAIAALRGSELARELLGGEFVEHFALSRQVEWDLWTRWSNAQVTEWELRRYFEVI